MNKKSWSLIAVGFVVERMVMYSLSLVVETETTPKSSMSVAPSICSDELP